MVSYMKTFLTLAKHIIDLSLQTFTFLRNLKLLTFPFHFGALVFEIANKCCLQKAKYNL